MIRQIEFPDQLTPERFLREIWQQRPLLMRAALSGFQSPLDPDELAGLACEPEVESRLVLEHGAQPWEVRHGPFDDEDFATLPESHWTLLVQDVDKQVPEVAGLLDAFGFIPEWRLDDIMVSYAADQGSVGPHTDEYDVFLIQAQGRRRWRIDPGPALDAPCIPGLDLRILQHFEPKEQWVLEPGDILYLPPGVPHWGIAEGPCMTFSVGLRAPDWRELATGWCDRAIAEHLPRARYRDPDPAPPRHRGEISTDALRSIRGRIDRALREADDDAFAAWFGAFVSESKEHLEPMPRLDPIEPAALDAELRRLARADRGGFYRPSVRLLFARAAGGDVLVFAAGETHRVPADCLGLVTLITERRFAAPASLVPWLTSPHCLDLLCTLYNLGHYELFD